MSEVRTYSRLPDGLDSLQGLIGPTVARRCRECPELVVTVCHKALNGRVTQLAALFAKNLIPLLRICANSRLWGPTYVSCSPQNSRSPSI